MKAKYIPYFRKWLSEAIISHPEYNQAIYFNRLYNLYTRKFR